ncbi:MAG TPA: DUF397 domain-containing protein [Streptosporangiaceae bacterium]
MDLTHTAWRKSSYSNTNGSNCVEVAAWRKSSHSNTQGAECVEVGSTLAAAIAVRDSKDPSGPALAFTPAEWQAFTRHIKTA